MKNFFHRTANAAGAQSADTTPSTPHHTAAPGAAAESPDASVEQSSGPQTSRARRRRRGPVVAGVTAATLLATGAVAYGNAHKTITLDVDGEVTTVTTFAGSVSGLLEEEDVEVGDRDLVVPAADAALHGGSDVVVRYGNEVPVQVDGEHSSVWLTALDADEALETLSSRGDDVRLVASRSGERASLPLRLDADGPVNVVVDGETHVAPDGSIGIAALLDQQGVALGDLDRVSVRRDATAEPSVSLVVQRVAVEEVPTTEPVPFETVTEQDADRYADLGPVVTQEGVEGVHTTVHRVTTVDGVEESRELVSEGVTTPPVDKVVVEGTKERPKPEPKPEPEPQPAQQRSSSSSSSGSSGSSGSGGSSNPAPAPAPAPEPEPAQGAVGGDVWAALAQCESGGNPSTNTGNGYYGLYQFSLSTWQAVGGSGLPSEASAAEQTKRAQILQQRAGWGQWPACSRKLGLR